jgi:DNA-binding HxlR family transcriptional regulator
MRGISLSDLDCSIARTLDIVGERWTLLVLRDAFNGVRRFDDFAATLPIARNVLTSRLQTLVEHGILRRDRYQERPARYEYRLTPKGLELYPVLVALLQWGDRHLAGEDGPPTEIVHRGCGYHAEAAVICTGCGDALAARDTRAVRRAYAADEATAPA